MNRLIIAKISEISTGVAFMAAGILAYGLGFIVMIYGETNLFAMGLLFFMSICGVEAGIFWIKRFYKMRSGLESAPPKRFVAKAAHVAVPFFFGIAMIRIVIMIAALALAFFLLIKYIYLGFNSLDMDWILIYAALIPAYWLLAKMFKPKVIQIMHELSKKMTSGYPTIEIQGENLILNLGMGFREKYRSIKIPLAEIQEMRVMDRYEGLAFLKYVLGPDLEFAARSVADKAAYLQGKIARPKFFAYLANSTGAMTLYLAGPELLYLVGVRDSAELRKLKSS